MEDACAEFPVLKESDDARHDVSEVDCAALLEIRRGQVGGERESVAGGEGEDISARWLRWDGSG